MRRQMQCLLAVAIILVATTAVTHGKESKKPVPTFVSAFEQMAKTLLAPFKIFDDTVNKIGDGIKGLFDKITGHEDDKSKDSKTLSIADLLNPITKQIKAIYPGTRWCGDGDIAKNKEDLGWFKETDACCRAHDSCPSGITAGKQKFGLLNSGIFTRSHCDCDEEFYRCLKEAHSLIATQIGTTYFNVLRPQCFRKEYPVINCKKYAGDHFVTDKCLEYNFDRNGTQKEQWFDTPDFVDIL